MRPNKFRDTDTCECGNEKSVRHSRCKSCRQNNYRRQHKEEIQGKDRIRKKIIATPITRVMPITRLAREVAEQKAALVLNGQQSLGPLSDTSWFRFTDRAENTAARVRVTSRPQVAAASKPWTAGFLPKTKYRGRETGVPVDMREGSQEVEQWICKKHYAFSVALRDLAQSEARRREEKARKTTSTVKGERQ